MAHAHPTDDFKSNCLNCRWYRRSNILEFSGMCIDPIELLKNEAIQIQNGTAHVFQNYGCANWEIKDEE